MPLGGLFLTNLAIYNAAMLQRFSRDARRGVIEAQKVAEELGANSYTADCLLLAVILDRNSCAAQILTHLRVDLGQVDEALRQAIKETPQLTRRKHEMTRPSRHAVDLAYAEARSMKNRIVGTEPCYWACCNATKASQGPCLEIV